MRSIRTGFDLPNGLMDGQSSRALTVISNGKSTTLTSVVHTQVIEIAANGDQSDVTIPANIRVTTGRLATFGQRVILAKAERIVAARENVSALLEQRSPNCGAVAQGPDGRTA